MDHNKWSGRETDYVISLGIALLSEATMLESSDTKHGGTVAISTAQRLKQGERTVNFVQKLLVFDGELQKLNISLSELREIVAEVVAKLLRISVSWKFAPHFSPMARPLPLPLAWIEPSSSSICLHIPLSIDAVHSTEDFIVIDVDYSKLHSPET